MSSSGSSKVIQSSEGVRPFKNRRLRTPDKRALVEMANSVRHNGRIIDGELPKITAAFQCSKVTVRNILREYDEQIAKGIVEPDLSTGYKDRPSRSKFCDDIRTNISAILAANNGILSYRLMQKEYEKAHGVKMSISTLHGYMSIMGAAESIANVKNMQHASLF